MTPKVYIYAFLVLLTIAAGVTGVLSYKHMATRMATAEADIKSAKADAKAAKLETQTLSRLMIEREQAHQETRDHVSTVKANIEKAKNEDPATDSVLRTRLPDGLRNAYK